MVAALEGDEIIVDILIACVSDHQVCMCVCVCVCVCVCMHVCIHVLTGVCFYLCTIVVRIHALSCFQGANLLQKNKEGLTARSLAFNNNHVRIVTLIDNAARLLQEEVEGDV